MKRGCKAFPEEGNDRKLSLTSLINVTNLLRIAYFWRTRIPINYFTLRADGLIQSG